MSRLRCFRKKFFSFQSSIVSLSPLINISKLTCPTHSPVFFIIKPTGDLKTRTKKRRYNVEEILWADDDLGSHVFFFEPGSQHLQIQE